MKDLQAFIEHLRADLGEAAAAAERQDIEQVVEAFERVVVRIHAKVTEFRTLGK